MASRLQKRKGLMQKKVESEFNIPSFVKALIDRLESCGERVYLVGGSLRDMLMGRRPHDFDLASSAEPMRVCEIFSDMRVIKSGLPHGTVTVISEGKPVEITTFRVDGEYHDMRRPDSVSFTRRIEDDLSRRDFTVNAMAYNENEGLIDLFGGADDLKNRIIRAVGNPYDRFSEDALRIMRAFRFSAQLGFDVEEEALKAATALCDRLDFIARERIFSELLRLICSPYPKKPLMQMAKSGALARIMGGHTVSHRSIELLEKVENDEIMRLAVLFSDCDGAGARKILASLKASRRQQSATAAIIDASRAEYCKREDFARLRARLSEDAGYALRLSVALGYSGVEALSLIEDKTPCKIGDLAIGGAELISLGFEGRELGGMLATLLDEVIKNPSLNEREALVEMAKKYKGDKKI